MVQAPAAFTGAPAGATQPARPASARTAPRHAPRAQGARLLVHDRGRVQPRARTTAGGYSGAQDSESSRKRWLRGSASAAAIMFFTAWPRGACTVSRACLG
jgi:hypothetical protein